jgi:hypothetical protein|tara:strand:- start:4047 stop:4757 length:711 start_codon:yes stop_codon:yes gene_type:complete
MRKNILIIATVTIVMLFVFGALMNSASADNDVTSSGATDNDLTNTSGSNTAITGGYNSEATTNYNSGSSSNNTTNNETNNNSYTGDTRVVPSANAAAIGNMNQNVCTISVAGGVQKFGLGVSIATHKRDLNCERMLLAKTLHLMNMKVAAISLLCADARVFEAMAQSGTWCPINGKIGTEAQEEWLKYGKLRPDYETYVAALRITEQIDNEILKELDDEESYLVDSNGDPVILGSD